ncbi:MAG: hypothetical protein ACYTJ0_15410, partial [Planctomycetota bacterium]
MSAVETMSAVEVVRRILLRALRPGLVAVLVASIAAGPAAGRQTPPAEAGPPVTDPLNPEALEAEIAALEPRAAQDPAVREPLDLYKAAVADLRLAAEWTERAARFERDRLAAASEMEQVQAELATSLSTEPVVPEGATLEQLEQLRDEAEAALREAVDRERELVEEKQRREQRRAEMPAERQRLRAELGQLEEDLTGPPASQPDLLADARLTALVARTRALQAQLDALDRELANLEARKDLLPLRQDRWRRRHAARERLLAAWRDIVSQAEQRAADAEARAAQARLRSAAPELTALAAKIVELTDLRRGPEGLLAKRADAERLHTEKLTLTRRLLERYRLAKDRARAAAGADVADVRLRRERGELPSLRELRAAERERASLISQVQLELSDLEFEFETLADDVEARTQVLENLDPALSAGQREEIAAELDRLLAEQRIRYRSLLQDYEDYLNALVELQQTDQHLIRVTDEFLGFINERILWIRSAGPISELLTEFTARTDDGTAVRRPSTWGRLKASLAWMSSPHHWLEWLQGLADQARQSPLRNVLALLAVVGLLLLRPRMRERLAASAEKTKRVSTDRITVTFAAFAQTIVLAAALPALLWLVAWRTTAIQASTEFTAAIAAGLSRTAALLFPMFLVWHVCRPDGLAAAHFRWRKATRQVLRRHLLWLMPATTPLIFVATTMEARGGGGTDEVGRIAFIGVLGLLTVFTARVLTPAGGVLEGLLSRRRGGWLDRLQWVWFSAAVATPVVLGVIAALGYFYTAVQFERRLVDTL